MKTLEEFSHNKGNVFVQQTTLFSEDRKNNLEGPYKVKKLVNIEDDKKKIGMIFLLKAVEGK